MVKQTTGNPADRFGGPGPGRPKGVPNKTTTAIKDMIVQALDKAGGVEYLVRQSEGNPTAFMGLVGKIIPTQMSAEVAGKIFTEVVHRIVDGQAGD